MGPVLMALTEQLSLPIMYSIWVWCDTVGKAQALQSDRLCNHIQTMPPTPGQFWATDLASLSLSFLFIIVLCTTALCFTELSKESPEVGVKDDWHNQCPINIVYLLGKFILFVYLLGKFVYLLGEFLRHFSYPLQSLNSDIPLTGVQ